MKTLRILPALLILVIGCNKTDISMFTGTPQIASVDSSVIAMPDIFTPNGDGVNDYLFVLTKNISNGHLVIKKKSGKIVFESTDISVGWNGKIKGREEREKEYNFEIDAVTVNGRTLTLGGSICLIRDNCVSGSLSNCNFSTQFNGTTFDPTLPSLENISSCN